MSRATRDAQADVMVLGGGLAGIATAVRLAEAGATVTLVETSRRLGGRASSHVDPESGEVVDNCQHVLMGCCTNLLDLYARLGVADHVAWHDRLYFADKQGHLDIMQASDLPAPLHLSQAMLRFRTLSFADKLAISRAMVAMMRIGPTQRAGLMDTTFEEWLQRHGQTSAAIERFWTVVIVSALNQTPQHAAAAYAIHVFQDGFLGHRRAYRMGVSAVPLRQLYDPAQQIIEAGGGTVRLGTSVQQVHVQADRVTGVELEGGELATADAYVSALPFDRIEKVLDAEARAADGRFAGLSQFRHSPILGIHLWFDRPVLKHPHLIFVDSPLQWVFSKQRGEQGEYLHGVISAADAFVDQPAGQILEMAVNELAAYAPAVKQAELVRGRVIKEKRATFSPDPGVEACRPGTKGAIANLLLAGDWVATGWPATMEGAVRSGYQAAAALLGGHGALPADLPTSDLYRLIATVGGAR